MKRYSQSRLYSLSSCHLPAYSLHVIPVSFYSLYAHQKLINLSSTLVSSPNPSFTYMLPHWKVDTNNLLYFMPTNPFAVFHCKFSCQNQNNLFDMMSSTLDMGKYYHLQSPYLFTFLIFFYYWISIIKVIFFQQFYGKFFSNFIPNLKFQSLAHDEAHLLPFNGFPKQKF